MWRHIGASRDVFGRSSITSVREVGIGASDNTDCVDPQLAACELITVVIDFCPFGSQLQSQ